MKITEGQEFTDGQFNYIAYLKSDGRMVFRDVEGFDFEDIDAFLTVDPGGLTEVDPDLEGYVKIERWEGEVGTLPRESDPALDAWMKAEESRGELAFVAETVGCYECGGFDGVTAPQKKVVRLGRVVDRADATQTYVLECGHTTI